MPDVDLIVAAVAALTVIALLLLAAIWALGDGGSEDRPKDPP